MTTSINSPAARFAAQLRAERNMRHSGPRYHLPEDVAHFCDHLEGEENIKAIQECFFELDESHLYPILDAFNVTEVAIRVLDSEEADGLVIEPGLEYAYTLDAKIREIVNSDELIDQFTREEG